MPIPLGRHNPLLKQVRQLARDGQVRRERGLMVLEGVRVLRAALDCGASLEFALARPALEPGLLADLEAVCPVHPVDADVLEQLAPARTSQGILAVAAIPPEPAGWEDLLLVLEGVADPGNLGTLLRTARAVAPCTVVVSGGADPYAPKVVRASAGAILSLGLVRRTLGPEELTRLGYIIRVAAVRGGTPLLQADFPARTAIVLGSEGHGPGPEWSGCPTVTIPMSPGCESLNVAMAGTLLLYEARRRVDFFPSG
ncbi:MAG: RNA methyltransferase [Candidatus Eremiobacterota bacterium]